MARRVVPPTDGNTAVQADVSVAASGNVTPYGGWGPFGFQPLLPPTSNDRIELRVWTQGTGTARVFSLEVEPVSTVPP